MKLRKRKEKGKRIAESVTKGMIPIHPDSGPGCADAPVVRFILFYPWYCGVYGGGGGIGVGCIGGGVIVDCMGYGCCIECVDGVGLLVLYRRCAVGRVSMVIHVIGTKLNGLGYATLRKGKNAPIPILQILLCMYSVYVCSNPNAFKYTIPK